MNTKETKTTIAPHKMFFVMAAVITLLVAIQPSVLSAQTGGVGSDGYTRYMWRGIDGKITLWKLDPNLVLVKSITYFAAPGAIPKAITVSPNNNTYVLRKMTDGRWAITCFDGDLNRGVVTVLAYREGYQAQSISVSLDGTKKVMVYGTIVSTGAAVIDVFDENLNALSSKNLGPQSGLIPGGGLE